MSMRGHTLVWHSQTPAAFFTDDNGTQLTKEQLYERLKIYMTTVMNRYKDVTFCWDVVNEALPIVLITFTGHQARGIRYAVRILFPRPSGLPVVLTQT